MATPRLISTFAVLLVSGSLAQKSACCQVAPQSAQEYGKIGSPRLDAKELAGLERQTRSLYTELAPSVVRFFNPKRASSGFSGVIVSPSGEVLTCAHHNLPPSMRFRVKPHPGILSVFLRRRGQAARAIRLFADASLLPRPQHSFSPADLP